MEDRTETIKLESGASYTVSWDDKCVVLNSTARESSGESLINPVYLEPELLPRLIDYAWKNKIKDFEILLRDK